jgi:ribosome-associated toxin RatA of RatAB toxin-antitoxin module
MKNKIHESMTVSYSAKQMYELVNDVESYSSFLPWCHEAKILEKTPDYLIARVTAAAKGIKKSFTTKNTFIPHENIVMKLVEGPFKHFSAAWHFKSIAANQSVISLEMEFEFSSKMMSLLLGKFLNRGLSQMIEAFSLRAKELYGS